MMADNIAQLTEVVFRIRRFDPTTDAAPRWEDYPLPYTKGMTVLDGLRAIKESASPTLSWRSSCRMGVCGSCGMFVNGRPRLACNTQITELGTSLVTVAPLPNFKTVRDLVPDLSPMFDAHAALQPYIIREDVEEQERPTGEYWQSIHQLEEYLQFSYCIKCGCCMAACPTYATDPAYSGPMPLAQAHRYSVDSRDDGFQARKTALAGEGGPWKCHFAGECSQVCPKGVDPARAIQLMKRALVLDYLHLRKQRCAARVAPAPAGLKRREGIPDAPPPTIEPMLT
ncbi:MAG TPA: succinate dehydrogenase iron-sulfur subunit [Vicinamibacterales bacterium]|nr:succinate dehydrogenase iron-sulfur subunit [Vicinamibacterales bacterium]